MVNRTHRMNISAAAQSLSKGHYRQSGANNRDSDSDGSDMDDVRTKVHQESAGASVNSELVSCCHEVATMFTISIFLPLDIVPFKGRGSLPGGFMVPSSPSENQSSRSAGRLMVCNSIGGLKNLLVCQICNPWAITGAIRKACWKASIRWK